MISPDLRFPNSEMIYRVRSWLNACTRAFDLGVLAALTAFALCSSGIVTAQSPRPSSAPRTETVITPTQVSATPLRTLAPRPTTTFGGSADTSDVEFSPAAGYHVMLPLPGERILFLDVGRAHIMTSAGKLVRTIGRDGSGPGEYRNLAGACLGAADTILLYDARLQRISVLDPTGSYARSINVAGTGTMYPGACFRDGRTLVARTEVTPAREMAMSLRIIDGNGRVTRELATQSLGTPLPQVFLGRTTMFVVAERIYLANGRPGTVTELRADGTILRTLTLASLAQPLTEAEWFRAAESMLPRGASDAQREAVRDRFRAVTRPALWPAFERVLPDGAGGLWVELSHTGSSREEEWLHFDSAWRLTERLRMPPGNGSMRAVVAFERSALYLRTFDEDGFVTLSRHAITPAARTR